MDWKCGKNRSLTSGTSLNACMRAAQDVCTNAMRSLQCNLPALGHNTFEVLQMVHDILAPLHIHLSGAGFCDFAGLQQICDTFGVDVVVMERRMRSIIVQLANLINLAINQNGCSSR